MTVLIYGQRWWPLEVPAELTHTNKHVSLFQAESQTLYFALQLFIIQILLHVCSLQTNMAVLVGSRFLRRLHRLLRGLDGFSL